MICYFFPGWACVVNWTGLSSELCSGENSAQIQIVQNISPALEFVKNILYRFGIFYHWGVKKYFWGWIFGLTLKFIDFWGGANLCIFQFGGVKNSQKTTSGTPSEADEGVSGKWVHFYRPPPQNCRNDLITSWKKGPGLEQPWTHSGGRPVTLIISSVFWGQTTTPPPLNFLR